jgi:nitrogen fixation-related uncharacterized protein
MPDKLEGAPPEPYKETVTPANPPQANAGPATVVAGMWYYLAPIALVAAVVLLALFYWANRDDRRDDAVEPTTGISDESKPGGGSADPKPDSTKEEGEFRGGNR